MAPVGSNQLKSFQFFAEKFSKTNPAGVKFEVIGIDNKLSPAESLNALKAAMDQGVRYITIHSSQWSSKPYLLENLRYHVAFQFLTHVTTMAMSLMQAATIATAYSRTMYGAGAPNASHMPHAPFRGVFNATTSAVPATIQATQISGSGANASVMPWLRVDADFNVY